MNAEIYYYIIHIQIVYIFKNFFTETSKNSNIFYLLETIEGINRHQYIYHLHLICHALTITQTTSLKLSESFVQPLLDCTRSELNGVAAELKSYFLLHRHVCALLPYQWASVSVCMSKERKKERKKIENNHHGTSKSLVVFWCSHHDMWPHWLCGVSYE